MEKKELIIFALCFGLTLGLALYVFIRVLVLDGRLRRRKRLTPLQALHEDAARIRHEARDGIYEDLVKAIRGLGGLVNTNPFQHKEACPIFGYAYDNVTGGEVREYVVLAVRVNADGFIDIVLENTSCLMPRGVKPEYSDKDLQDEHLWCNEDVYLCIPTLINIAQRLYEYAEKK